MNGRHLLRAIEDCVWLLFSMFKDCSAQVLLLVCMLDPQWAWSQFSHILSWSHQSTASIQSQQSYNMCTCRHWAEPTAGYDFFTGMVNVRLYCWSAKRGQANSLHTLAELRWGKLTHIQPTRPQSLCFMEVMFCSVSMHIYRALYTGYYYREFP